MESMSKLGRILMVEDDPKDVELSLTALEEYNLVNEDRCRKQWRTSAPPAVNSPI